jgi:hypothetical protein
MNKFKTEEDFLSFLKNEIGLTITPYELREKGVKKKNDGFYHQSQTIDILKDSLPKITTFPITPVGQLPPSFSAGYPILNIDPIQRLDRSANITSYEFAIQFYNPEFQVLVSKIKDILGIPVGGLENCEERIKWFKRAIALLQEKGFTSKPDKDAVFLILTKLPMCFFKNIFGFSRMAYYKEHLLETVLFDYITLNDPFFSLPKMNSSKEKKNLSSFGFKVPLPTERFKEDNFEIHIAVYPETSKDEIKSIIDSAWKSIEEYKKRIPFNPIVKRMKNVDTLRHKLYAYDMHRRGFSHKKIATKLKINVGIIKKMISNVKKDIERNNKIQKLP